MDTDRLNRIIRLIIDAIDKFESDTEDGRYGREYAKRMILIRNARGAATQLSEAFTEMRSGGPTVIIGPALGDSNGGER